MQVFSKAKLFLTLILSFIGLAQGAKEVFQIEGQCEVSCAIDISQPALADSSEEMLNTDPSKTHLVEVSGAATHQVTTDFGISIENT